MMIDFALEAEREREASRRATRSTRRALLRFRPIMMTTMAALLGGAAARARHAASARSCAVRSASRSSAGCSVSQVAHALHDAGHLPRVRPLARRARRRAPAAGADAPCRARREPLRAVHPAAGRDDAAHDRRSRSRASSRSRLLPVAPLPQVDFPTIQRHRRPARREPRDDGGVGRDAARAPVRPHRRRDGDDVDELARHRRRSRCSSTSTATSTAPRATCRPRSTRRAATCRRTCRRNPTLSQGQPGRRADPDPRAHVRHACRRAQMYDAASTILAQKIAQVEGVGQVIVGGGSLPAVRVEVEPAGSSARYGLGARRRARGARARRTRTGRRAALDRRRPRPVSSTTNDQLLQRRREYRPRHRRYARTAQSVRLADVADASTDASRTSASPASRTASRRCSLIIFRQPGANIIETVDRVPRAAARSCRRRSRRRSTLDVVARPHDDDPRVGARRRAHAAHLDRPRHPGRVRVPAQRARDAHPERRRAGLADRHVRRHVPARLQPRQPVADGAHDRDRVRRRRRDRRASRTSRATSSTGMPPLEAALRGAREIGFTVVSISVSLVAVFIPILLDGRHRRPAVPRVRRDAVASRSSISLVVSLTTTPMMCARLLRAAARAQHGRLYRGERARASTRLLARLRAHARLGAAPPLVTLLVACRDDRRSTSTSTSIVPKGFFPQQDTGRLIGSIQATRTSRSRRCAEAAASSSTSSESDPAVDTSIAFTGGGGGGATQHRRGCSSRSSRSRSATRRRRRGDRPPAPRKLAHGAGRDAVPAAGAGHPRRRPREQRAVPVHAPGRRPRRARRRGRRSSRGSCAQLPGSPTSTSDQQTTGLQASLVIDRDTASRARRHAAADRRHALRRVRPAPGLDDLHAAEPVPRRAGGRRPQFWQRPDALRDIYVRVGDRARRCRSRRSRSYEPTHDAARRQPLRASSRR